MRSIPCRFLIPALTLLLAPALHAEPFRTFNQEIPTADVRAVEVESEFADVAITGGGGEAVQVEVEVSCASGWEKSCTRAAEDVDIDWRLRGGKLRVKVRGTSKIHAHHISVAAKVIVPRKLPVEVSLGVGDVSIEGMTSDIEIDAATGDVEIHAKKSDVHIVEMDLGFGDAALYVDGSRLEGGGGILNRGLTWRSEEGHAVIDINLGSGDSTVRLN